MNKHRKAAEGRACVRCGRENGTTVLAHYQGPLSSILGKAKGLKPHDLAAAWLCFDCHRLMDRGEGAAKALYTRAELAHEFAILCLKTVIIRYEEGQLRD